MRHTIVNFLVVLGILLVTRDLLSLRAQAGTDRAGMTTTGDAKASARAPQDDPAKAGRQALAAGQFDAAVQWLSQAIERTTADDEKASLLLARGDAQANLGRSSQAMADYTASLEINADQPDTLVRRALLYRARDDYDNALADLRKAIELDATNINAQYTKGAIEYGKEHFAQAEATFSTCITLDPTLSTAYFNRAYARMRQQKMDLAKADMTTFIKMTTNDQAKAQAQQILQEWSKETP